MRNFKSGFILSYISIFIQSIISILYTPVMLRLLGESNYGLLQLAVSTMSSLSILSFGFGSSYMRFYSQYKADNDNNAISVLNGMFTIIFIFVSILSLIVGGFITMNTSTLFGKSMTASEIKLLKTLLGIMTVNIAFTFPCSISDSYIIAQERFSFQKIPDYNIVTFKSHADFSVAHYGTWCSFRCDLYDGDYRYKTTLRYGVLYKKT